MPEKKINLEEIISSNHGDWSDKELRWIKSNMLEFGKQLLKVASENAKTELHEINENSDRAYYCYVVNKESILNTINQIE